MSDEAKNIIDLGANVRTTFAKGRQKQRQEGKEERRLVKEVVNCLNCGKIYDCRAAHKNLAFINSGGICSFCAKRVKSFRYEGDDVDEDEEDGTDEASFEANELKDTLVTYDRESASRTTVIDDQNDYFSIESNAWLSDSERATLRQMQMEEEEAKEEIKKKLLVTIDLLGRRVLTDASKGENSQKTNHRDRNVELEMARAATLAEKPRGGGSAARLSAASGIRSHITASPSFQAAGYVFMPGKSSIARGKGDPKKNVLKKRGMGHSVIQREDPFDMAAREIAEELGVAK